MEETDSDKHSNLLQFKIKWDHTYFYSAGKEV